MNSIRKIDQLQPNEGHLYIYIVAEVSEFFKYEGSRATLENNVHTGINIRNGLTRITKFLSLSIIATVNLNAGALLRSFKIL